MAAKKQNPRNRRAPDPSDKSVIPRSRHPISRKNIDKDACTIMRRLNQHGHEAYLVGGAVRDLYLGKRPKDYDIATDATPSRLRKLFRNCRIIGRRFKIAHIFYGTKVIEVATFRQSADKDSGDSGSPAKGIVRSESGIILRDNAYGTPKEDARRRDLTINGLFYDMKTFSVLDYVNGVRDLKARVVRMINDPDVSFAEDPVRMLRAVRHAARTGFEIEDRTMDSIIRNHPDILQANSSRLLEELLKDLRSGAAAPFFKALFQAHLLGDLLPTLSDQLADYRGKHPFWRRMEALDELVQSGKEFSTPTCLAMLLFTTFFEEEKLWDASSRISDKARSRLLRNFQESTSELQIYRRYTERVLQVARYLSSFHYQLNQDRIPAKWLGKNYAPEVLDCLEIELESLGKDPDQLKKWRKICDQEHRKREEKRRKRQEKSGETENSQGGGRRPRRRGGRRRGRRGGGKKTS